MLRITDTGNLPNKVKGLLKDAIVIGAASGHLSSESIEIRLERLTKIDKAKGIGIDIPVKGYVAGENGDSEIRGKVFDRAGTVKQQQPVIKVDGGRKVTIVFTESVKASTVSMKKVRRKFYARQY